MINLTEGSVVSGGAAHAEIYSVVKDSIRITSIREEDNQVTLAWESVMGEVYDVVATPSPRAVTAIENWSVLTNNVPAQGSLTEVVLPIAADAKWTAFRVRY